MLVVNQARCQRCGRAMERVAEIAPFGSEPGLVAFPCSDCGSTLREPDAGNLHVRFTSALV